MHSVLGKVGSQRSRRIVFDTRYAVNIILVSYPAFVLMLFSHYRLCARVRMSTSMIIEVFRRHDCAAGGAPWIWPWCMAMSLNS